MEKLLQLSVSNDGEKFFFFFWNWGNNNLFSDADDGSEAGARNARLKKFRHLDPTCWEMYKLFHPEKSTAEKKEYSLA